MPHYGYPTHLGEGVQDLAEAAIERSLKRNRVITAETLASFIVAGFVDKGRLPMIQQINDDQDISYVYEVVRYMTHGWRIRYAEIDRSADDRMSGLTWTDGGGIFPPGVVWWRLQTLGGRPSLYGLGTAEEARKWADLLDSRDNDGRPYVPLELEEDAIPFAEFQSWGGLISDEITALNAAIVIERERAAA
jgi:hypothetical protein